VATQKSKRRSRKRRSSGSAPRAVPSPRRDQRAERQARTTQADRRAQRQLGKEGERPPSPFGGLPISEILIFAGLVAVIVWLIAGGVATLVVGIVVVTLGVLEVTAREHLTGYRSHTTLLAAIPAVALGIGVVSLLGTNRNERAPILLAVAVPVFAFLFWLLRKRFQIARQARVARPPSA
jgi:Flp pilus assembly protein TadB